MMLDLIDAVGVIAFAISGIRLAALKDFDVFGAFVIGFVTAIGGGTIRDTILDAPIVWMQSPMYILLTIFSVILVMVFRNYGTLFENTLFLFDTVGLALYTVIGIEKTIEYGYPFWAGIVMGMISGAAGGVLRDVLLSQVPLIFRKEIYATACIAGGLVFFGVEKITDSEFLPAISCAVTVCILRIVAVIYGISIPKLRKNDISNDD